MRNDNRPIAHIYREPNIDYANLCNFILFIILFDLSIFARDMEQSDTKLYDFTNPATLSGNLRRFMFRILSVSLA